MSALLNSLKGVTELMAWSAELWCLVVVHGSLIALGKIVAAAISARAMVRASDQRHLHKLIQGLPPREPKRANVFYAVMGGRE